MMGPAAPDGPPRLFGVSGIVAGGLHSSGTMSTGAHFVGPDGRPALGSVGVLVDEVLGLAISRSLGPHSVSISTEITVDLVSPLPADGAVVSARGRVVGSGSLATGELVAADGRLLAVCRQRGREVATSPVPAAAHSRGDPARGPSLVQVLGLEPGRAESMTLHVAPHLVNARSTLHGGVSLWASEIAATRHRAGTAPHLATCSVSIAHLRPVPLGVDIEFHVSDRHAGRSLWVSDVVGTVEGRTCTAARVTAEPAMPWIRPRSGSC